MLADDLIHNLINYTRNTGIDSHNNYLGYRFTMKMSVSLLPIKVHFQQYYYDDFCVVFSRNTLKTQYLGASLRLKEEVSFPRHFTLQVHHM